MVIIKYTIQCAYLPPQYIYFIYLFIYSFIYSRIKDYNSFVNHQKNGKNPSNHLQSNLVYVIIFGFRNFWFWFFVFFTNKKKLNHNINRPSVVPIIISDNNITIGIILTSKTGNPKNSDKYQTQ